MMIGDAWTIKSICGMYFYGGKVLPSQLADIVQSLTDKSEVFCSEIRNWQGSRPYSLFYTRTRQRLETDGRANMRNPNILLQRRRSSVNLNSADDNLLNRRRSSIGMAGEDVLQHFSSRRRSSVVTNGQPPAFSKPNSSKRGPRSPPLRRDSIGSFQICRGTCCSRLLNVSEELNVPIHAGFGRCCRRVSKQLENVISDEACARRFTIVTVSMFLFIFCVIGFSVYQRLPKLESGPWARFYNLLRYNWFFQRLISALFFWRPLRDESPLTNWRECKAMRILFYPTDQTIQKEKREWNLDIFETLFRAGCSCCCR